MPSPNKIFLLFVSAHSFFALQSRYAKYLFCKCIKQIEVSKRLETCWLPLFFLLRTRRALRATRLSYSNRRTPKADVWSRSYVGRSLVVAEGARKVAPVCFIVCHSSAAATPPRARSSTENSYFSRLMGRFAFVLASS